jgi:hypothetical protein
MTLQEYIEAIKEIADEAPLPQEARTLNDWQAAMDDMDNRMCRISNFCQDILRDGDLTLSDEVTFNRSAA